MSTADPWISPGDATLRHDLTLLADVGILRTPVTTWPISWPDVARDIAGASATGAQVPAVEHSLQRVSRAARAATAAWSGIGVSLAASESPDRLRGFTYVPREKGEAAAGASWLGERFAASIRVTATSDPQDGQAVRLDGSYVGAAIGNFMVSIGAMDRWWGPGWDGSLILSSNARPVPSLTVERNYTDASRWPVLRWFGPWRASLALGRMEGSDVAVPDVEFMAARVTMRPRPWLEVGLSRTAQWCGQGRPCDFDTFLKLLAGRDNRSDALGIEDEPGNQLAGYDLRVRMPWRRVPTAFYLQAIGEDESGGLPSKFLGLLGAEISGGSAWGSWRARLEYADTTCVFTRSTPQFDCAYRNSLYPQGYTHRRRVIGHSLDGDGRIVTGALMLVRADGDTYALTVRDARLNRDGNPDPVHTVSPAGRAERLDVEVSLDTALMEGRLLAGVGFADYSVAGLPDDGLRAFVRFSRGLR